MAAIVAAQTPKSAALRYSFNSCSGSFGGLNAEKRLEK